MKSRILIFSIVCILSISGIYAQNNNGDIHLPETIDYPYIFITQVEVKGNKLTKEEVLIKELDINFLDSIAVFSKDDLNKSGVRRFIKEDSTEIRLRLDYSRDNIINTGLFLTVDLYLKQLKGSDYQLSIDVTERHYWWIFPVLKLNAPNFNEWLRDIDLSQLSMGLFASHNNLFGTSHQASMAFYIGPSWAIALGYRIPWLGKRSKKKEFGIVGGYNNLAVLEYASVKNIRQMLYVRNSFTTTFLAARIKFRPRLYHNYSIALGAEYVTVSDSVFSLNPDFLAGQKTENFQMSLYIDYYYDTRNNRTYPLTGTLLGGFIDKKGLGIISRDVNIFYYGIDFHFYQKISEKFYVAEMVKAVNSAGENNPYYYQLNMVGKKDFIRGYDLYTIKGDQMYYFRSNFKYELIKPNTKMVKPGEEKNKFKSMQYAFYLNAFADVGYVTNKFTEDNPLNNKMLFSWGLGLDFVTYYDMVLRFEYAFTSVGTNGFFFGFGMPI